jgi:hypothetical protein
VSDQPDAAVNDLHDTAIECQPGVELTDAEPTAAEPADTEPRPKRRFDRGLFIASLVIACGVALIIFGLTSAITGTDGIDRPEAIESVQPVENAVQVLRQDQIIVNLVAGHEARLVVDGIELPTTVIGQSDVDPNVQAQPGQQVDAPTTAVFDPGNAVISFQPVEGALIETFTEGTHEVTVYFWTIEEGPDQANTYTWTFEVI